ncbi:MAG: hypothetical protein QXV17_13715 [Candidatus Micrarchaeaceae archaeon]
MTKRDDAVRRWEEIRFKKIGELLEQQEMLKGEIQAGKHVIKNQFKLLKIRDKLKRLRGE